MAAPSSPSPGVSPSIYVASLLDARHPPDALLDRVQAMLERSPTTGVTGEPAEEWAIFDSEGFGRRVDQFESLEDAHLSATARAGIS